MSYCLDRCVIAWMCECENKDDIRGKEAFNHVGNVYFFGSSYKGLEQTALRSQELCNASCLVGWQFAKVPGCPLHHNLNAISHSLITCQAKFKTHLVHPCLLIEPEVPLFYLCCFLSDNIPAAAINHAKM